MRKPGFGSEAKVPVSAAGRAAKAHALSPITDTSKQPGPQTRGEFVCQTPHDLGYALQQFVRLAGVQCHMSADEIAFHNRAHNSPAMPTRKAG